MKKDRVMSITQKAQATCFGKRRCYVGELLMRMEMEIYS